MAPMCVAVFGLTEHGCFWYFIATRVHCQKLGLASHLMNIVQDFAWRSTRNVKMHLQACNNNFDTYENLGFQKLTHPETYIK